MIWVAAVELDGVEEVRKAPGYHDEPLKGSRAGQRSIRLSRSYRARVCAPLRTTRRSGWQRAFIFLVLVRFLRRIYDGHAADEKFSALGAHVSGRSALSQGALTSKVAR